MPEEKIFPNGFIFKEPKATQPEFVKGTVSIKCDDFKKFMDEHESNGWINIDLLESRKGQYYSALNTWKPKGSSGETPAPARDPIEDGDLPF